MSLSRDQAAASDFALVLGPVHDALARYGAPVTLRVHDTLMSAIEQLREARTRADRGMQYGTFGAQRQEQEQAAAALGLPDLPWWKWLALGLALGALVVGAVLCFFL